MNFRIWDRAYNKWVDDYVAGTHFFVETYLTMDGKVVKFAAGFPETGKESLFSKEDAPQYINGKWYGDKVGMEERYVVLRGTGMNDINGKEIFEGDNLIEYPENRQRIQIANDIYEIRDDLPRAPLMDAVIRSGVVEYCAPSFVFKYSKESENGAVSGLLSYGQNYEVTGNIYEK